MIDFLPLHERLLEVALQRSLGGFEQAMKRTLALFQLNGWACIFPPSIQSGGRALFVGHAVKPANSPRLARIFQEGREAVFLDPEAGTSLLSAVAREIAPVDGSRCRILRVTRAREIELVLICYRPPGAPDFDPNEVNLLTQTGRLLDRCFQVLAQDQDQEFQAGLFRMVGNLHPEGLCILDVRLRSLFENRKFREHMHCWNHGSAALQNLSLPRSVELPPAWRKACEQSFQTFQKVQVPPTSGKMVVSQGPVMSLRQEFGSGDFIEGSVRYVAFQTALGVRPYMMLTSVISPRQTVSGPVPFARLAKVLNLSRRETELAELILIGAAARKIGQRLNISLPTVKTHIRHILRKANVRTRLEFVGLCRDPLMKPAGRPTD
jgi:DNA-binding CsgD family transcriptional regulator